MALIPAIAQTRGIQVERSPMALRAANVGYAGRSQEVISAERFEGLRQGDGWFEARSGHTVFFPAHLASLSEEGLGIYDLDARTWKVIPPFDLAARAGWYTPHPDDGSPPNTVQSVAIGGGRAWIGTAGVGVLALDLDTGAWSRYDVKAGVLPGIHSTVLYADDDYVFVLSGGPTGGWEQRLPGVREEQLAPALEVHSLRREAWLRVRAVARENVLEFGWTGSPAVAMPCDTRPWAQATWVPLESCRRPRFAKPAPDKDGYELGRELPDPGAPIRFLIRRSELEQAFHRAIGVIA